MGYTSILMQQQQPQQTAAVYASMLGQMNAKNAAIAAGEKALPTPADKGALVIEDSFQWSGNPMSPTPDHGVRVQSSAEQEGFKGKIYERTPDLGGTKADQNRYSADESTMNGAENPLDQKAANDKFLGAVRDNAVLQQTGALKGETSELNKLQQSGMHDGAVNLSTGVSKQNIVGNLYYSALLQPAGATAEQQKAHDTLDQNYGKAFGFDPAQLSAKGDAGANARHKLQQGLIDQVNQAVNGNTEIKSAQAGYDQAVGKLAKNNVSVVVAGENGGEQQKFFGEEGNGKPLTGTDGDYYHNPLADSQAVTVGAVGSVANPDQNQIAAYNSPVKDDILANGINKLDQFDQGEDGTSFATPRVAAALAQIHGEHPGMSNEAALALLKKNDTHALPSDPTQLVLDPAKTSQLLAVH